MHHSRTSGRRDNSNNGTPNPSVSPSANPSGTSEAGAGPEAEGAGGSGANEHIRFKKHCRYGTFTWSREVVDRPRLAELENTFFGKRVIVPPQIVKTPSPDPDPDGSHHFHHHLTVASAPLPLPLSRSSDMVTSPQQQQVQASSLEERAISGSGTGGDGLNRSDSKINSLGKVGRTATVPVPKPTRLAINVSPRSKHARGGFGRGYVTV